MKIDFLRFYITIAGLLLASCQKDYLARRPDQSLLVPTSVADFQALLDNPAVFNISPALPVISSDDFRTDDAGFNAFASGTEKNSYTWAADIFGGEPTPDWDTPYQQVFYANVVLDGVNALAGSPDSAGRNTVKGSALFFRAFAYANLVQEFAKGYDAASAATDPGVPVRLTADVNAKAGRGTVQQVYDQVLSDLNAAAALLPVRTAFKSRPSRAAAYAMLARVCLSMGSYDQAAVAATSALQLNSTLVDYNDLDTAAVNPFPNAPAVDNPEMIFYDKMVSYLTGISPYTTVDPGLYAAYAGQDLRKSLFFGGQGPCYFKGRYTGIDFLLFGGLAVDELYLVRAEAEARTGDAAGAMKDLNTLLVKRYAKGNFVSLTATAADQALLVVLQERRKELVFRGLRWGDLKRLNQEPRFKVTLSRTIAGKEYELAPGDQRYVLPIPAKELAASGMVQNER